MTEKKKFHPTVSYVAPFAVFILFLGIRDYLPLGIKWEYVVRVLAVSLVFVLFSRRLITWRPSNALGSVLTGIAVFGVWILPDLVWPDLRNHWLFSNSVTGKVGDPLPQSLQTDTVFLLFRIFGTAVLVPIIEELFWRAWMMRYLIKPNFETVALGTFSAFSFAVTAILFATEHGPYWEVGLLAGIGYGWWMVRTKNISDCILAHSVTNACLAFYVLAMGHWRYWL